MMNPEIKKLWIEDLRSGKHEQCTGELINEHEGKRSFCCLGRLCEVMGVRLTRDNQWNLDIPGDGLLPRDIIEATQLTRTDQLNCSDLNDLDRLNFNQIAYWIEKNL